MSKIDKYSKENEPTLSDFLVGTKASNGKTKNFSLEAILQLLNSSNGVNNIQFKFSNGLHPNIDFLSAGYFFTNTNTTEVGTFTQLIFNKETIQSLDLSPLFNKLGELQNIIIKLENPSDPNNFFNFKVVSLTDNTDYFTFVIEDFNEFYLGEFVNEQIYSLYFDINSSIIDDFSKVVYFNALTPETATIFDLHNPPVTNDNALKIDDQNLYIGSDASTWVYKTSIAAYETKLVTSSLSNFYLSGTTTDAGNSKTANLKRTGRVGGANAVDDDDFVTKEQYDLKEDVSNKSTSTSESSSTVKFPVWAAIVSFFSASQIRSILGISTLSGINTGDETTSTILTKIGDGSKIGSAYLPSYVDDILEGYLLSNVFYVESGHTTVIPAESGKIYIDLTTGQKNKEYRYSGSAYIQITNGLIASTADVPEDSGFLYFTTARVLATVLTGISFVTGTAITATDSILVMAGKLQKQISDFSFQIIYGQSTPPQITTTTAKGALIIKRGSVADSDTVLIIQNGAGTEKASIDGNGYVKGSRIKMSGGSGDSEIIGNLTEPLIFNVINQYDPDAMTLSRGIISSEYADASHSAHITGRRARGSFASPTSILSGDYLAGFTADAYNGTVFKRAGNMAFIATGVSGGNIASMCAISTVNSSGVENIGFTIDQNLKVVIGTATGLAVPVPSVGTAKLTVASTSENDQTAAFVDSNRGSSGGAGMVGYSDGSVATLSGDRLGYLLFGGAINTVHALARTSGISSFATENWSATVNGSDLRFFTCPNGSASRAERGRFSPAGNLGIGLTAGTDAAEKLEVNGNVKATSYKISAMNTAPSSSTDTGSVGEIRITSTYIYVCTATNTWVRVALATW